MSFNHPNPHKTFGVSASLALICAVILFIVLIAPIMLQSQSSIGGGGQSSGAVQDVNITGGGISSGTAGNPSADVVSIQGITNGTPVHIISDPTSTVSIYQNGPTSPVYAATAVAEGNLASASSNGTTGVDLVAANATSSTVVQSLLVVNNSTTSGFTVELCNGTCDVGNFIRVPVPKAATSDVGGVAVSSLLFSTTKNTKLQFKCNTDCSTSVDVSVTYSTIVRP